MKKTAVFLIIGVFFFSIPSALAQYKSGGGQATYIITDVHGRVIEAGELSTNTLSSTENDPAQKPDDDDYEDDDYYEEEEEEPAPIEEPKNPSPPKDLKILAPQQAPPGN